VQAIANLWFSSRLLLMLSVLKTFQILPDAREFKGDFNRSAHRALLEF